MSLDKEICKRQLQDYPEVDDCIRKSERMDNALPSYEYLFSLKDRIPKELYACYFRKLLQFNTRNVPIELRLKMFEGVKQTDIMYQDELDAIQSFGDEIILYRGTSKNEKEPGLSWSRRRDIAEGTFSEGRIIIAKVPTSSILLYLAHEEDEGEVIAHVTSNYIVEDE